jgi:nucleoside-diphosphate-sugar epimerase
MRVLVTGAAGIVGMNTVDELLKQGRTVRLFDLPTHRNRRTLRRFRPKADIHWGDIRNRADVLAAVRDMDAVIHLAAVIPPLADRRPELAESVNVGGTANLLSSLCQTNPAARFLFTSSISVYGDRVTNPYIGPTDPLTPNPEDHYAHHKIKCEEMIRHSGLAWTIFRLSYIVSVRKLAMDPIMFDIPLATSFEICDSSDAALALANALNNPAAVGETLPIAGGARCRISYRDYLSRMLEIFGVGGPRLPERAFKTAGFHCGFMETQKSQSLLRYQRSTLADYFSRVSEKTKVKRFFISLVRAAARYFIFARSPYLHTSTH